MNRRTKLSHQLSAHTANVLFAPAAIQRLEAQASLPAKFQRMLDLFSLKRICAGGVVAVKMHVGGSLGFTTIPPLFVRLLVQKIKNAGAKHVFLTDGSSSMSQAAARGYTEEVLGAPLIGAAGIEDRFFYRHKVKYRTLKELEICGNIQDADALINLCHFKGHGTCGYGAACKNLAMGCVTNKTRRTLHHLEGGLVYHKNRCIKCRKCIKACPRGAAKWNDINNRMEIFFHNCTYCQHCMLACPKDAIEVRGGGFVPFQRGLALAAREVLGTFAPGRVLHINFLTQITVFCDCWGFSTPALMPDVGILASENIVAVDKAGLDMTCDAQPLPGSLPPTMELGEGRHLFERIHAKDPYVQIEQMEKIGMGSSKYRLRAIN